MTQNINWDCPQLSHWPKSTPILNYNQHINNFVPQCRPPLCYYNTVWFIPISSTSKHWYLCHNSASMGRYGDDNQTFIPFHFHCIILRDIQKLFNPLVECITLYIHINTAGVHLENPTQYGVQVSSISTIVTVSIPLVVGKVIQSTSWMYHPLYPYQYHRSPGSLLSYSEYSTCFGQTYSIHLLNVSPFISISIPQKSLLSSEYSTCCVQSYSIHLLNVSPFISISIR